MSYAYRNARPEICPTCQHPFMSKQCRHPVPEQALSREDGELLLLLADIERGLERWYNNKTVVNVGPLLERIRRRLTAGPER